jgi:hypothetical protein
MSPSGAPKGRGPASGGETPWAAVPGELAELVRPGLPGVVEDVQERSHMAVAQLPLRS